MTNVLIRDVDDVDLDLIRAAAAAQGDSLQAYLRAAVHERAAYLRRRATLAEIERRLSGLPPLSEEDRLAAFDAFDNEIEANSERRYG